MPRGAPRISSIFLVVESAESVREALCYSLLSFGIKGVPASSRKDALAAIADQSGIEGAIIDIDNSDVEGMQLINDLKAAEATRRIAVIVHTIQSRKEFVRKMVGIRVAGYLLKPFSAETARAKLEQVLAKLSTHNASRRHIRVSPDPDELTRVSFRITGVPQLMTGRIVDVSLGGMAIELFNPPAGQPLHAGNPHCAHGLRPVRKRAGTRGHRGGLQVPGTRGPVRDDERFGQASSGKVHIQENFVVTRRLR